MNQIWFGLIWIKAATTSLIISSPPLPHTRKNKHTNILDDLFWVGFWKGMGTKRKTWETYFGMGGGEKALQCIVTVVIFLGACVYFFGR